MDVLQVMRNDKLPKQTSSEQVGARKQGGLQVTLLDSRLNQVNKQRHGIHRHFNCLNARANVSLNR